MSPIGLFDYGLYLDIRGLGVCSGVRLLGYSPVSVAYQLREQK